MRKFYSIKYENIFAFLYAPYLIINTSKADVDMILLALLSHIITLLGIYYTIRVSRREALEELKKWHLWELYTRRHINYIKEHK